LSIIKSILSYGAVSIPLKYPITDPAIYILTHIGNESMIEEWKVKTAGN
jgi:hypothetical protein